MHREKKSAVVHSEEVKRSAQEAKMRYGAPYEESLWCTGEEKKSWCTTKRKVREAIG